MAFLQEVTVFLKFPDNTDYPNDRNKKTLSAKFL